MATNFGPPPSHRLPITNGPIYISGQDSNTNAPWLTGVQINTTPGCFPSAVDSIFPDDKDCPACASCKGGHTVASIHWAGREHVMLLVCGNCSTTVELEELPGGLVAKAIQDLSRNMLERMHEGEDIPGDDAALLDWLGERLAEERQLIEDAAALVETMQLSLRARSPQR